MFPWQRNITPPGEGNGQAWNWGRRTTFSFWSPQRLQFGCRATRHLEDVQLGNKEPGPSGIPGLKQRRTGVMEKVASVQLCPDPQRQRRLRPLGASLTRTGPGCLGQRHSRKFLESVKGECKSITLHVEKDVTAPHSVSQASEVRRMDFVSLDPDHSFLNPFSLYVEPGRTRLN